MEFDFSQNGEVAEGEFEAKVPEQFRSAYGPAKDGKRTVDDAHKGLVSAITGLNGALKKERTTSGSLRGQKDVSAAVAEALGDLGITSLDDAKARITELNQTVAEKAKVDPVKIRADIEKAFATKEDGYKQTVTKMQGTLEKYLVDANATAALSAAKGNIKLLLPHIKAMTVVVPDGDDYVVRVKDGEGSYRGNGAGGFMSVEDLVKEFKASPDFASAFASEQQQGSGRPAGRPAASSQQQRNDTQRRADADRTPGSRIADGLAARRRG